MRTDAVVVEPCIWPVHVSGLPLLLQQVLVTCVVHRQFQCITSVVLVFSKGRHGSNELYKHVALQRALRAGSEGAAAHLL